MPITSHLTALKNCSCLPWVVEKWRPIIRWAARMWTVAQNSNYTIYLKMSTWWLCALILLLFCFLFVVLTAAVTQASLQSMLHKILTAGPSAFNITTLLSQAAQLSSQGICHHTRTLAFGYSVPLLTSHTASGIGCLDSVIHFSGYNCCSMFCF